MEDQKKQTKICGDEEKNQELLPICLIIASSNETLISTIKKALEKSYHVITPKDIRSYGTLIIDKVNSLILDADLIIADVSRINPNITYEIGIAVGLRKPVILIKDKKSEEPLPTAFGYWLYIQYNLDDLKIFNDQISRIVANYYPKQ